ncbi:MAG: DNA cytosine methyltransferase [Intestinibacter bartlettii]|uniref:DNA cytosine methyltransferase n=1 Tax=Intestinibacter bartlettii TaxID=261299 RepID=UPI0024308073|nr:DNA (cytosine-5-)-methyltransferase [Intestinibacter bartlettii]MBS7148154.1 DNA cytosine methyltransferase [Intestinibacter bartlettii]
MNKINSIELFAGCGGFVDGFEKTNKYNTIACVEWNKKPCEVLINRLQEKYDINSAKNKVLRFDIQRTDELINGWEDDDIFGSNLGLDKLVNNRKIDIIVGGPPCQAYSMAGRIQDKNGMKDDYRNYLFESYIKVVQHYDPKVIVFENVEGMLSASPGGVSIIERITSAFKKCGYHIINDIRRYALLDLSEYGIPQKRKRVILVGLNQKYFKGNIQDILEEFYGNILKKYKEEPKTVREAICDLPKFYPRINEEKIGKKKYSHYPEETSYCDHYPRYHNKRDIEIFRELALDIETKENKYITTEALKLLYTEKTGKNSNVHKYNVLKWDSPSNTIPAHLKKDGLRHIHPDYTQARTITVREAARLQTFDDDFKFSGSMSLDYEMIGNAVPPKFANKLANSIYELLEKQGLL